MGIAVNCPSCQNSFTATEESADGPFLCPHCASLVAAPGTSVRQAVGTSRTHPAKGARPQLLDRLPPSPVTSPAFVLGAGAFVLAYGVVMAIVLSGPKDDPTTTEDFALYESTEPARVSSIPEPPPIAAPKPKGAAPKPSGAIAKPEAPDPKKEVAPAEPPPKPVVAKVTMPAPTPKEKPKAKAKKKSKPSAPKPIRTIANLEKLIDDVGDCKLIKDATGLTIAVPGKLHVLSPELNIKNSPMVLIDVEGDFVAQVKVAGEVMPGRTPVEKMPFAFHGAGLLLWKDKDNYVRLERAGAGAHGHPHTHQILVEVCKDGKPAGHNYVDWPPGPTYLRMERRKADLLCSHSEDGQSWIPDKALGSLFRGKVSVGVSASNTSKKAFPARFEEFTLDERPVETSESDTP
jgi:regulation of enolase protein 1 (concanavalin A-like superfamily)